MSDTAPASEAMTNVMVFDHSSYSKVLVYVTGEVNGHEYKRGVTYYVNDDAFNGMKAAGMLGDVAPSAKN